MQIRQPQWDVGFIPAILSIVAVWVALALSASPGTQCGPLAGVTRSDTAKIESTATRLASDKKYQKDPAGATHCSEFVRDFGKVAWGYDGFEGKDAKSIVEILEQNTDGWKPLNSGAADLQDAFTRAQNLANRGYLVVVGFVGNDPHGNKADHVALVVCGHTERSGAFGMSVAQIAQAGAHVSAKEPLSSGFYSWMKDKIVLAYRDP